MPDIRRANKGQGCDHVWGCIDGFASYHLTEAERPTDKKVVIRLATSAGGVKLASYLERM